MPDGPKGSATGPADAAAGQPALPAADSDPGYDSSGVPTFDAVREKIEARYETSIGAAELDSESPAGRSIDEQYEARQKAAADRLAEIRESMHEDSP
jgi:phage shock protein A